MRRMRMMAGLQLAVILAATGPSGAQAPAAAAQAELAGHYNPVLLDYLLDGAGDALGAVERTQAIEAMLGGLRDELEASRARKVKIDVFAAGPGRPLLAPEQARAAYGAAFELQSSRIAPAADLVRAGYAEEGRGLLEECIRTFDVPEVQLRCALELAESAPEAAIERLFDLVRNSSIEGTNTALLMLGELGASESLTAEHRLSILAVLEKHTKRLNKATHGEAAVQAMGRMGDPAAIPMIQNATKGRIAIGLRDEAFRALALVFGDRSVLPKLLKIANGKGLGALEKPDAEDQLEAAAILIEGGEDAGYQWAEEELSRFQPRPDLRNDVVDILARYGDERTLEVIQRSPVERGSYLDFKMAIALLEMGDVSRLPLVHAALEGSRWPGLRLRAARALARTGEAAGVEVLNRLYDGAVTDLKPAWTALDFLTSSSVDQFKDNRAKLRRIKQEIAGMLASIDTPESIAVLTRMLDDKDPMIAVVAAYGLARVADPAAFDGLLAAAALEYRDKKEDWSRLVWSTLARRAATTFAGNPGLPALLEALAAKPDPSVRFLARAAAGGSRPPAAAGAAAPAAGPPDETAGETAASPAGAPAEAAKPGG